MTKKPRKNLKNVFYILVLLIIPYLIIRVSIWFSVEEYGRLIVIPLLAVIAPIWAIWYSVSNKNKKEFELPFKGKRISSPIRVLFLLMAIATIYYLTIPFLKDIKYLVSEGIPMKEGRIVYDYTPGHGIMLGYQRLGLEEDPGQHFISIYSTELLNKGDDIRIWYLPKSGFVLKTEHL